MIWRFQEGAWREAPPGGGTRPSTLRLVTFNLWFEAHEREARCRGQAALLQELDPDIMGLQEATLRMLEPLLAQEWVRSGYWCSASSTSAAATHGVVMLARVVPDRLAIEQLPGQMGRRLLWADFGDLRVGVVHLESMGSSAPARAAQLAQIFPRLAEAPSAVLMGDFNMCSTWEENANLDPAYLDLWPTLRPTEPGWTEDTSINTMRAAIRRHDKAVRFDRMLLRSATWRARDIELIGTRPLGPDLFCSDHFGLVSQILEERAEE